MNNTDLNIRPEVEQDKAFVEKLYRSTREDLLQLDLAEALIDNLIRMQFQAQQTSYRMQFPAAEYSIVEKEGEAVGYLIVNRGNEAIRLVYIALLPSECNKGHGRHLIQALQTEASGVDKPLTLSVDPQNMPAKHLYLSSGFQVKNNDSANLEMIWLGHATG